MTAPTISPRAQAMSEKQWQSFIVQFATLNGWWHHHEFDSRRSTEGWPDLTLIRAPELLFVECKTHNGKVTAEQGRVHELLEACNQEIHVWRPQHEPEVIARLKRRTRA